jgi:hypothetical protein
MEGGVLPPMGGMEGTSDSQARLHGSPRAGTTAEAINVEHQKTARKSLEEGSGEVD